MFKLGKSDMRLVQCAGSDHSEPASSAVPGLAAGRGAEQGRAQPAGEVAEGQAGLHRGRLPHQQTPAAHHTGVSQRV